MESVNEIKEALSARSRTATLDELRSEGRKRVRLIRAEHVAAMISEAVHTALDKSGLVGPDEVNKLIDKSRQEFRAILQEREQELRQSQEVEDALQEREHELLNLKGRFAELSAALQALRTELTQTKHELEQSRQGAADAEARAHAAARAASSSPATEAALAARDQEIAAQQRQLQDLTNVVESLRAQLAVSQAAVMRAEARAEALLAAGASVRAPQPAPMPGSELILSLLQEMAALKAGMAQQPAPQPAPSPAVPDFSAAIEKLTGSLNERLETLGKKMGISAAVDTSAPVDFGGLFKDTGKTLESNIENIEVKQKSGGGIAANLARLKKLKGG